MTHLRHECFKPLALVLSLSLVGCPTIMGGGNTVNDDPYARQRGRRDYR